MRPSRILCLKPPTLFSYNTYVFLISHVKPTEAGFCLQSQKEKQPTGGEAKTNQNKSERWARQAPVSQSLSHSQSRFGLLCLELYGTEPMILWRCREGDPACHILNTHLEFLSLLPRFPITPSPDLPRVNSDLVLQSRAMSTFISRKSLVQLRVSNHSLGSLGPSLPIPSLVPSSENEAHRDRSLASAQRVILELR